MFCGQCGAPMQPNDRFCPTCGAIAASGNAENPTSAMNGTPTEMPPQFSGNFSAAAPKKKRWIPIVSAVAAVAVAGVVTIVIVGNVMKSKPIPALALGLQNLADAARDMDSFHLALDEKNTSADMDFSVNAKKQQIYAYGTLIASDMEMKIALCAEEDEGAYVLAYDGEYYTQEIPSSNLKDIWNAYDEKDVENYDLQEYLEDYDYADELDTYIDIDESDDVYRNLVKRLSKRGTQKELEEALEIDVEKKDGERVYTVNPDGDAMLKTADLLLDILDDEAEDAIRGDWLDEAREAIDDAKDSGKLDDIGTKEHYTLEYRIKSGKLTGLTFDVSAAYTNYNVDVDFSYRFGKLTSVEGEFSHSAEWADTSVQFTLDEINKVDDVKEDIPSEMLDEMNME